VVDRVGGTTRSRLSLPAAVAAVVLVVTTFYLSGRASGDDADRCARFAAASASRAAADTGSGPRVAVIGDSYSVGLGLDRPAQSWPAQLPGRVHVDGFSGWGFSARASGCGPVSFADRAAAAATAADLVVVEGGLNDTDRSDADIRAGFARLMRTLAGHHVLVVGPAAAPARSGAVPRVDALLAELAAGAGATYLRMSDLQLTYLDDRLHLSAAGHVAFGAHVAAAVAARLP
jgi:acyl-CoA thioesterase-1